MANENSYTAKLIKVLNRIPDTRAKKRHGGRFQSGDPDVAGVFRGFSFFIEAKVLSGELTPLQAEELERWRGAGAATALAVYAPLSSKGMGLRLFTPTHKEEWSDLLGPLSKRTDYLCIGFGDLQWREWLEQVVYSRRDPR